MDNPFQSPETASSPVAAADDGGKRPHLMLRLFYGCFFGGLYGLFFGTVGAVLLSIARDAAISRIDRVMVPREVAALLGALSGAFSGGVIGPLATLIAAMAPPRLRYYLPLLIGGLAAIAGLLFGMVGGLLGGRFDELSRIALAIGGLIGLGAGSVGGWLLGRFLRRWNF